MATFHKAFIKTPTIISVILYVLTLNLSFKTVTWATTTAANLSDPCYNYTVLDEPWRATNNIYASVRRCDTNVTWSGWYRLFINGLSAHIPDTCVAYGSCGTNIALWIRGGHPTVQDGVVTRDVCGNAVSYCCYLGSYPIKVKACSGNYYVYELIRPAGCNFAYCADVSSINTSSTAVTPATLSTANLSDPCYNYTVLDEPWRATNNTNGLHSYYMCDQSVAWSGWYRLFINGLSAHIPDTCVARSSCGTNIALWIRGGHPTVQDGVVTRDVCGNAGSYCCYVGSYPIKVKACPGNYYVYELVSPAGYYFAYCADVSSINTSSTTVTPATLSTVINITLPEGCTSQTAGGCLQNLLEQTENITAQVVPLSTVLNILNMVFNASEKIVESSSSASPAEQASYGNLLLKTSEKLISALVKPTVTSDSVSFTLPAVEGQVFMVGPLVYLDKIPRLDTTNSSMDIDLIGIARNNNERSAAVAFMSYNTMENLLKPDFFNTPEDTIKTMMSTVISATLPKTTNTTLTKPVIFTFKHIREFDPRGSLSCVNWNISEWIVDGCSVLKTNRHYTVCSCDHLSIFALIMQTSHPYYVIHMLSQSNFQQLLLIFLYVTLGVVFSLALLTLVIFIAVYFHV